MIKHKIDWSHSILIVELCFLFLWKLETDQCTTVLCKGFLFCFVLCYSSVSAKSDQKHRITLSILSFSFIWGDKKDSVIRRQFVCYFICVTFFCWSKDHSIFTCDKWERHDIVWTINKRKGVQKPYEQCKVLNTNNQLWQMPNNVDCALKRIEIGRMPRTRTISDKSHIHVFFVLQWWRWWSLSIVINICPKVYRPSIAALAFIAVFCSN